MAAGGALDDVAPPTPGEWDDATINVSGPAWYLDSAPPGVGRLTPEMVVENACVAARDEVTRGEYDGAIAAVEQVLTAGRAADHVDHRRAATFVAWVLSHIVDDETP